MMSQKKEDKTEITPLLTSSVHFYWDAEDVPAIKKIPNTSSNLFS